MNRRLLALAVLAVSCGPAASFEVPPLGVRPTPQHQPVTVEPDAGTPVVPDAGQPFVTPSADGLPCDVRAVLEAHCTACHGGSMYVPHLNAIDHFRHARAAGKTVGQIAVERLAPMAEFPMPPTGHTTQPSAAEALVLINWVTSGMPAGTCGVAE